MGQSQDRTRRLSLLARGLRRLVRDRRGNISPLMALLIVPILGAMALGGEVSSWFMAQRSLQNAADSAVLAAAQRGDANYATEATAVVKAYGLTPSALLTVSPTTVSCPAGAPVISGSLCYQVQIDQFERLYLSGIVGFKGEATIGTNYAKRIRAAAIAGKVAGSKGFCMDSETTIIVNGAGGHPDFGGCDFLSGTSMNCNGTNANVGIAHGYAGTTNGTGGGTNYCGVVAQSSYPFPGDNWEAKVASNLSNTDTSDGNCPVTATITSLHAGLNCFRPDPTTHTVALAGNISVGNPNTVLVIKNGGLDLKSFTLSTAAGGSMTLVYTGTQTLAPVLSSSGGIFDVAAPTAADTSAGTDWSGIVIAEDPNLTGVTQAGASTLDLNFAGGGITFRMTGLVYLPNAEFNINGAINHATSSDSLANGYLGQNCFAVYAHAVVLGGTVDIFDNPVVDCNRAGLEDLPKVPVVRLLG